MSNFYHNQKLTNEYLKKIVGIVPKEGILIDQIILNVLDSYEISEKFVIRTLERFESVGLIKISNNKIFPIKKWLKENLYY